MSNITSFTFITLDGYYKGPKNDISWHQHGEEESEFSEEGLNTGNTLLFGRITYQMMESFWPTPMAAESFPAVAEGMNNANKIVFSNTLKSASWNKTKIVKGNIVAQLKKMKQQDIDMTLLGSGSILSLLAQENLIDRYQIMIDPIAIGKGTSLFKGIDNNLKLTLQSSRVFKSGCVLLSYQPIK